MIDCTEIAFVASARRIIDLKRRIEELEEICKRDRFADGYHAGCEDFQKVGGKRIEALEAQIRVMQQALVEQSGRINALRAALRGLLKANEQTDDAREIARAALAPKQDECIHAWSAPFDGMVKCTKCGAALAPEQDK